MLRSAFAKPFERTGERVYRGERSLLVVLLTQLSLLSSFAFRLRLKGFFQFKAGTVLAACGSGSTFRLAGDERTIPRRRRFCSPLLIFWFRRRAVTRARFNLRGRRRGVLYAPSPCLLKVGNARSVSCVVCWRRSLTAVAASFQERGRTTAGRNLRRSFLGFCPAVVLALY